MKKIFILILFFIHGLSYSENYITDNKIFYFDRNIEENNIINYIESLNNENVILENIKNGDGFYQFVGTCIIKDCNFYSVTFHFENNKLESINFTTQMKTAFLTILNWLIISEEYFITNYILKNNTLMLFYENFNDNKFSLYRNGNNNNENLIIYN